MAPLHALIRRVLQLRVGLVAIKELSSLLSKPPFSRTSTSRGTKKLHITTSRSDRSRQTFFSAKEGNCSAVELVCVFTGRAWLVHNWINTDSPRLLNNEQQELIRVYSKCETWLQLFIGEGQNNCCNVGLHQSKEETDSSFLPPLFGSLWKHLGSRRFSLTLCFKSLVLSLLC